jgi:hypothetical protein
LFCRNETQVSNRSYNSVTVLKLEELGVGGSLSEARDTSPLKSLIVFVLWIRYY